DAPIERPAAAAEKRPSCARVERKLRRPADRIAASGAPFSACRRDEGAAVRIAANRSGDRGAGYRGQEDRRERQAAAHGQLTGQRPPFEQRATQAVDERAARDADAGG